MISISCSGTLGDAYITILKVMKLFGITEEIKIYHFTRHTQWSDKIKEIYSLLPNIEVEIVNKRRTDLMHIDSTNKAIPQEYFPRFEFEKFQYVYDDYIAIQAHAGKERGYNAKYLNTNYLQNLISNFNTTDSIILLGTNRQKYGCIYDCLNLVEQTSLFEAMSVVKDCRYFIGPEGLLSFVALSFGKKCFIYYSDYTAIQTRIIDTPWENLCEFRNMVTYD